MSEQTEATNGRETPPYFSGTTFYNFVEAHRRSLPTRIDRSIMQNIAGGDQARILKALAFFDLIRDDGTPTDTFETLRDVDGDEAQRVWADLLTKAYPFLFSGFDLTKATQGQIEERFREQGIKGDTVRKAVTFFITLARIAGLKLSPYFKATRQRTPRGPGKSARPRQARPAAPYVGPPPVPYAENTPARSAKTIRFRSGGTAELRVDVDVVALSREDREALFAWIDAMGEYEERTKNDERPA